jgi:CBS domain-containing protein
MGLTVGSVMTKDVYSVSPEMTILEMDQAFISGQLSGAPVVSNGRLVGVVSRSDVLRALSGELREQRAISEYYREPVSTGLSSLEFLARESERIAERMRSLRVKDVMTQPPRTVGPGDAIESVAQLMTSEGLHRLPVTDGERLVGLVTSLDMTRLVWEFGLSSH